MELGIASKARLVALLLLLFGLSLPAAAQGEEHVPVDEDTAEEADGETGPCPEPDLNCHLAIFPRQTTVGIVPSDVSFPNGTARQRHLAKTFFRLGVLETSGQINGWFQNHTLFAVEFDWFLEDDVDPPVSVTLGIRVVFETASGEAVCHMYCYDLNGFMTRQAMLELAIGHPMYAQRVWTGATVRGYGNGDKSEIKEDDNIVRGSFAADKIELNGAGSNLIDGVEYVEEVDLASGNSVESVTNVSSVETVSIPMTMGYARWYAQNFGTYYSGGVTFESNGSIPGGFIYAEGDIEIKTSGQTTTSTFCAGGAIKLEGSGGNDFTCAYADLMFVAYDGDIEVKSGSNRLEGEILGAKDVKITGNDCTFHGLTQAKKIIVDAHECLLSDGTH
ncbi:MAG: hypothetical protein CMJ83_15155 [Planctomycetes bacterium]|nr:hypothetical protein [Planctomycetota bacterium]